MRRALRAGVGRRVFTPGPPDPLSMIAAIAFAASCGTFFACTLTACMISVSQANRGGRAESPLSPPHVRCALTPCGRFMKNDAPEPGLLLTTQHHWGEGGRGVRGGGGAA